MKNEVGFQPIGKRVEIESGTTILEAAQQAGVGLSAICGGEGSCDACRIRLDEGYEECYSKLFSLGGDGRRGFGVRWWSCRGGDTCASESA